MAVTTNVHLWRRNGEENDPTEERYDVLAKHGTSTAPETERCRRQKVSVRWLPNRW
jgi:hypothetical protein